MKAELDKTLWIEANQRYLAAALTVTRILLARHVARATGGVDPDAETLASAEAAENEARAALPAEAALDAVCRAFALSSFERAVLLLCAGVEMNGAIGGLCAAAHGVPERAYPTFGLALAALPDAHWSALAPDAPLRFWRLVEVGAGGSLATSPLRIDERVLHFLAGVARLDERLAGFVELIVADQTLVASHAALAAEVATGWMASADGPDAIVQLCGTDTAAIRGVAGAACSRLGLRLYVLPVSLLPHAPVEWQMLQRLWEREAVLGGCALLLECESAAEAGDVTRTALLHRWIESCRSTLLLAAREPRHGWSRPTRTLEVARPSSREQLDFWKAALGSVSTELNGHLDRLVAQFDMSVSSIGSATRARDHAHAGALEDTSALGSAQDIADSLWDSCRTLARPRLDDLAQRIVSQASWADLVLPERSMQSLREIAAHVRHRVIVYDTWGFGTRVSRGLGISVLFSGPSGTGKTLAAEVLAAELKLDLYRIDLSQVVSKYIGETEKNLRRVFDAAEQGGAVLLFDEADALFGKRSEVKDSHDRFANIEVSYLLQRMEAYRGLAILTTNMKEALDQAFLRRLRFVVPFPFPDAALRAQIWRRMFPREAPTDGVEVEQLARLNIPGGNIRNVALNAAFLAADAGEPLRMKHLLRAARTEYAKIERALTDAESGGWR